MLTPIPDILDDLRAGKMIILVDDEQRENEGDLVCAAEFITPQIVNFMVREARGVLCLALAGEICDRLELYPQTPSNTAQRGTAFLVSIDAHHRFGITTGVSAADRAKTIQVAIADKARPADLARPGHINPLRARDGGVLVRAGQTEGSVDLCRLAGLKPAAVIIEIMNEDGTMARMGDLQKLAAREGIRICSVADVIEQRLRHERLVERVAEAPLATPWGTFTLMAYQSAVDSLPHVALVCGDLGRRDAAGNPIETEQPVLVRMHSQNLLGDVFGDLSQPSSRTLAAALKRIHAEGLGALVYLRHERMGEGLVRQLQTSRLLGHQDPELEEDRPAIGSGHAGGDTPSGSKSDYGIGSQILRDLGIRRLRLLTNHPVHPTALSGFGLEITEFLPVDPE